MGWPETKPVLILTLPLWQVWQVLTVICVWSNIEGTQLGVFVPNAGGMAVLAQIAGRHVIALLAHRLGAVVAAHAAGG